MDWAGNRMDERSPFEVMFDDYRVEFGGEYLGISCRR